MTTTSDVLHRAQHNVAALVAGPRLLSAICGAAFAIRLAWMLLASGTIDTEGAEYTRIADNLLHGGGFVGIATPGTELLFPPLFPLLIAAFALPLHNVQLAGQTLSLIMGALLVIPIYRIAFLLYGRTTALAAALLVAFHPFLVALSTTVFCESTYLTLVFTGVYWTMRCQRSPSVWPFAFAGVFFGLSYLIRPEAFLFPFLAAMILICGAAIERKGAVRQVAVRSLVMIGALIILALPYVLWLHDQTGQYRLEGKGAINYAIGTGVLNGVNQAQVEYGIDANLNKVGVWMASNLSIIQNTHPTLSGLLQFAHAQAFRNLGHFVLLIVTGPSLGAPILFGLTLLGLARKPPNMAFVFDQLLLCIPLGVAALALLTIYRMDTRFVVPFLPGLIIWAAEGLVRFSRWSGAWLVQRMSAARTLPVFQSGFGWTTGAAMMLMSAATLHQVWIFSSFGPSARPIKLAGEWIDQYKPGPKTIMDGWTILAYHAHASYLHFPYADEALALRYIDHNKVDFIVLSDAAAPDWPYVKTWMSNGVPNARLVYNKVDGAIGRIEIYQRQSNDPAQTRP